MENDDETQEILRGIQSSLAGVRADLSGVRADLAGTNLRLERLANTTEDLVRHQIAMREAIDSLRTQAVMALERDES